MKESEAPYSKTKLSFMFTKTTPDFLLMSSKLLQIAIGSSSCDLFGDKGFLAGLSWLGLNTLRLPLDCQKKSSSLSKTATVAKKKLSGSKWLNTAKRWNRQWCSISNVVTISWISPFAGRIFFYII